MSWRNVIQTSMSTGSWTTRASEMTDRKEEWHDRSREIYELGCAQFTLTFRAKFPLRAVPDLRETANPVREPHFPPIEARSEMSDDSLIADSPHRRANAATCLRACAVWEKKKRAIEGYTMKIQDAFVAQNSLRVSHRIRCGTFDLVVHCDSTRFNAKQSFHLTRKAYQGGRQTRWSLIYAARLSS